MDDLEKKIRTPKAEITSGSSFEPNRTETGVCLRVIECENDLEKKTRIPKS